MKTVKLLTLLLAGLICLAGIGPLAAKDNLVTREYDVLDLGIPVIDAPALMHYSYYTMPPQAPENQVFMPAFSGDQLVEAIKSLSNEWGGDSNTKIGYQMPTGKIVVTQTAEMHKLIEAFLAYVRGIANPQVSIEARLIVINNAVSAQLNELTAGSGVLSDPALALLSEKGVAYKTAQKSGSNGNLIPFSDLKLVTYQKDYDVVIINAASSTALGDIIIDTVREGLCFNIRPIIAPNKNIRLDIQFRDVSLVSIDAVNPALSNECRSNIELPVLDETNLSTSLIVPDGRSVLAGLLSVKEADKNLAILLTPSINADPAKTDGFPIPGTNKVIKFFDLKALVMPYADHFIASTTVSLTPGGAPDWVRQPAELPSVPVPAIEGDQLEKMISSQTGLNLDPDGDLYTDPNSGRCSRLSDTHIYLVIQNPEGIRKITEFIKTLAKPPELITVSAQLVSVADPYWKTLIKDKKVDSAKGLIDLQALKTLLAEDGKGQVRILSYNQVTGPAGQSVLALNARVNDYLQDIDIQAGATAYEPVISSAPSNSALNVKSIAQGGLISIIMDWRYSRLLKLEPLLTAQGRFVCHKPQMDLKVFYNNLKVADGVWTIVQSSAARDSSGVLQNQILLVKAGVAR